MFAFTSIVTRVTNRHIMVYAFITKFQVQSKSTAIQFLKFRFIHNFVQTAHQITCSTRARKPVLTGKYSGTHTHTGTHRHTDTDTHQTRSHT